MTKPVQAATAQFKRSVYYLPGFGGYLHTGLGAGLLGRGWGVTGRATVGDFRSLGFDDQVATVVEDLRGNFWHSGALVVANSFGSYLFLHAQAQLPPFPGRVLLLSPIVGDFENTDTAQVFMPPRSKVLKAAARAGKFPTPSHAEIHVGADDWQCVPADAEAFGALTGIPVTVVPGRGHLLGADYVGALLDRWLADAKRSSSTSEEQELDLGTLTTPEETELKKQMKARRSAADKRPPPPAHKVRVWTDKAEDLVPYGGSWPKR
jgi:hypothetical protein